MSALLDKLKAAGIDAYDNEPKTTPNGAYAVVTNDPGRDSHRRLDGMPNRIARSDQVRFVARTQAGLDALITKARAVLTSPACRVIGSLPTYPDGPDSDRRLNAVLILSTITRS